MNLIAALVIKAAFAAWNAGVLKKAGFLVGASALTGLVWAAREEQNHKWATHKQQGDLILTHLNTTLDHMDKKLDRIDERVNILINNELRDKRGQKGD